ncbi:phytanoyl-CoA dioxygenase family protein [Nocardia africana]|uniref:Phytanoyl-CoA dioxygenase family protein n=1 Tax=Nocardia africana TaxID=134964 RepID=A0ABW6NTX0_9NOCA
MDMDVALANLGVSESLLDEKIRAQLDNDGFALLPGILSADEIELMRKRIAALSAAEGVQAGSEFRREAGTDRLSDLVNKDSIFDVCFTHATVLAAIRHILNDFKLFALNSRAALPGQGHQVLHADWTDPLDAPDDYQVCNSIWLLDDFTAENGATRVVPGTHRRGRRPSEELADPAATHPDEVLLLAPAGTVVVFNSHLWHGGTRNTTKEPRRALHCGFVRRHQPQLVDQAEHIRVRTRDRLSPGARFILDV